MDNEVKRKKVEGGGKRKKEKKKRDMAMLMITANKFRCLIPLQLL